MAMRPPGPKGLPVVGSTGQYARDPFRFMDAVRDAYGDIARFDLGGERTYMLTDPADVERVLLTEEGEYRKPEFQADALGELLGTGLILSEGDLWRRMRELSGPAFRSDRLSSLVPTMVSHTQAMTERWDDGNRIAIEPEMARVTVAIITEAMFGDDLGRERVRRVQENLEPLGRRFEPDPIRFLLPDWVPTPGNRSYRASIGVLEDVLSEVLAERGSNPQGGDLLSILVRAREEGAIDETQVRDELMTMLLAGHDTTALTLTYAWWLLGTHPQVEARLHEEFESVLGGEPPETARQVRELQYAGWVLNEAMRLYPPVYTMFRQANRDVTLAGYEVEAGSMLMLPQWAIHRDPRWFDDPERFDPERWEPERAADRPRFSFFPFGGGSRSCIGRQLSMLEAKAILATVASEHRLEPLDDRAFDLRASLTLHPGERIEMGVHDR